MRSNFKLLQAGVPAIPLLVASSGFAAGAAFGPAVFRSGLSAGNLIPSGAAGAVLLTGSWLGISAATARKSGAGTNLHARRLGVWFAVAMLPLLSYLPYLAHRSGLTGAQAELPPLDSRYSAIGLLVWSLLLLAVLLRLSLGKGNGGISRLALRRPAGTLALMICAWLAVFFPLDVLKEHYMQVTSLNSAVFREAMTHVFDGRGFMYSHLEQASGSTIFGVHINLIYLLVTPLFRLFPDYRWLLLISDAALALAAWPLYLLARRHFPAGLSLLFAAMYLLTPIIAAQPGRSDVSEIRFMPLFFFLALYMLETKRFWWFLGASFLLASVREDMALFVAFFGIYALVRRYPLRWILTPLASGGAWFLASTSFLLPHLSTTGTAVRTTIRYSDLGSSGSQIAKTLLLKPWKAFEVAFSGASHAGAAYGLFLSFGTVLPLISGAVVFAVPAVAELLFEQTTDLVTFMAVPAAATLIVAFIYGLARLDGIAFRRWGFHRGRTATMLGVFLFFLGLAPFHAWLNQNMYLPRYNYSAAIAAFKMVPPDARVLAPEFMLANTTSDQTVTGYHQIAYQEDAWGHFDIDEDYVILDERIPSAMADDRYYQSLGDVSKFLSKSPDFHKVFEHDDMALYVRNGFRPATPPA